MTFTADVYKLCCNDVNIKEIYVGSTRSWRQRKSTHKSNCDNENSRSYDFYVYQFIRDNGGFGNWSMISLYNGNFENRKELHRKEREFFEELKATLNKQIPTRTRKEYKEDNKEAITEQNKHYTINNKEVIAEKKKQYRQNNKEYLAERDKQPYNCDCGSTIRKGDKSRHLKTKKHQNYINSIPLLHPS